MTREPEDIVRELDNLERELTRIGELAPQPSNNITLQDMIRQIDRVCYETETYDKAHVGSLQARADNRQLSDLMEHVCKAHRIQGCLCDIRRISYDEAELRSREHCFDCWCFYCLIVEAQQSAWERRGR